MRRENTILNLKMTALMIVASVVLPFAEDALPFGERLILAQIPVLLAGLLCGASYGVVVGLIAPFLSFVMTGEPAVYPDAVAVALEYALFAAVASPIFRSFARRIGSLYASLVAAMVAGRLGFLGAFYVMLELRKEPYTLAPLVQQEFVTCWPGLLLQLIAVPLLVIAAEQAGLLEEA